MNRFLYFSLCLFAALFFELASTPGHAAARMQGMRTDAAAIPACSWDKPGQNPYMGDVVAAVDRYADIAPDVRERLRARMLRRDYDDVVTIKRDSITGKRRYGSTISDMHFGTRQLCRSVSRAGWSPAMQERGLVYCDSGQCILVPTICRNVSRISRAEVADERAVGDVPPAVAVVPAVPAAADSFTALSKGAVAPVLASAPVGGESGGSPAGGGGVGTDTGFPGGGGGAGGGGYVGGPVIGPPGGGGTGDVPALPVIPAVPVSPVPEPETWALMLAGLATCVAVSARTNRRARKHQAPSA